MRTLTLKHFDDLLAPRDTSIDAEKVTHEFCEELLLIIHAEDVSKSEKIRCLTHAKIELQELHQQSTRNGDTSREIIFCFKRAILLLDLELDLINKSIEFPQINARTASFSSRLYLSKEYTQTDLIELMASLHAAGAFRKENGNPADFSDVVKTFEVMFNVKFTNLNNKRWAAINRKIRLTKFLDILKNALINLSMK